VGLRDLSVDPPLQARSERPEVSTEYLDTNLYHTVGLAFVLTREFLGDLLKILNLMLQGNERLLKQTFNCGLIVGLQDQSDMTHPLNIRADNLDYVLVLIDTFVGDHMCEYSLGRVIAHQNALDDLPLGSSLLQPGFALQVFGELVGDLASLLHPGRGDEEIVDANCGYAFSAMPMVSLSAALAQSTPFDALAAPIPERVRRNP